MADHKHHHRHRSHGAHGDEHHDGAKPNGKANGHAAGGDAQGDGGAQATAEQQQPTTEQPQGEAQAQGGGDELQAVKDKHLRLAAEFENYRKRVERERSEAWVRAQAQLAERLLEPLDDLQRIADFDPATTPATALHEGAEMVEKKFLRALESAGLEEIDAAGKPFDPTQHEALATAPAESADEDDTVAQVYRKGYRFKGVLLRPAQVVVKKHG
ncbi:MAG TPA: nucleotide exchange factor GrpE [Longimicrobiaceae bacterium]